MVRHAVPLVVIGVLVLLVVSWYPLQLEVPRLAVGGVERLDDGSLRFSDDEFASTSAPPSWLPAVIEGDYLEVSLRIGSDAQHQSGPARILALSAVPWGDEQDVLEHNLVIGQDGTDLVARVVRPGSNRQGRPDLVAPGVFSDDGWHDVELVIGDDVTLRVDGEVRAQETSVDGWADVWPEDHRLSLGNTLSGTRPWSGTITRAEVLAGTEQVDLLNSDELEVAGRGTRLPPRLLEAASRMGTDILMIGVLHVLLGAAIGGAVVLALPGRPLASSLWIIVALAAAANVGKVFVVTRHPSIATFLLQVGGGGLGAMSAFAFVRDRLAVDRHDATHGRT